MPLSLRLLRGVLGASLVPDTYVARYANYSTGLAAVSNGQSFAAPIDSVRDGVWLKTAGVGVMTGAQPLDSGLGMVRPTINAIGPLPDSPLLDLDSIDGLWTPSEFLNRAPGAAAPGLNILWAHNGARTHFLGGGMTETLSQTDSQGGLTAVRLEHASGAVAATLAQFILNVFPGQWTFQFDARTTDGSSQSWLLGTNGTTGMAPITITGTRQTFSGTFSLTSTATFRQLVICQGSHPSAAAAAGTIFIENVRLVPGATPQAGNADQSPRAGYFLRGNSASYSGAALTGSLGSTLAYKPASTIALTDYTLMFCASINRPSSVTALLRGAGPTMGRTTYQGPWFATTTGQTIDLYTVNNGSSAPPFIKPASSGMQVQAIVFSGGVVQHWVDGVLIASVAGVSPVPTSNLLSLIGAISSANGTEWPIDGTVSGVALWATALSGASIADATAKMSARLAAKGLSKQAIRAVYLAEGDSITLGANDSSMGAYTSRAHGLLTAPRCPYQNTAVSGAILRGAPGSNSLQGRFATDSALIAANTAKGWTTVMSVLIGTNDGGIITTQAQAEGYFADLAAYVASVRAQGAKVIICTQIPVDDGSNAYDRNSVTISGGAFNGNTYNGLRNYIRAMILASPSSFDGIADFGGDAAFTSFSGTYFSDTKHPNPLGHSVMASILAPVLQTVVNSI